MLAAVQAACTGLHDRTDVELIPDLKPKRIRHAPDMLNALAKVTAAQDGWDALASSYGREHSNHVEAAKRSETRARRIGKLVASLQQPRSKRDVLFFEVLDIGPLSSS